MNETERLKAVREFFFKQTNKNKKQQNFSCIGKREMSQCECDPVGKGQLGELIIYFCRNAGEP